MDECNRFIPVYRKYNRTSGRPASAGAKGGFKGPVDRRIIVEGQNRTQGLPFNQVYS